MLWRDLCPVQLQEARAAHTSLWLLHLQGWSGQRGVPVHKADNLLLGSHHRAAPDVWCKVGWSLMTVHVVPPAFHLPLPPTFLFHVATFPPQCQTSVTSQEILCISRALKLPLGLLSAKGRSNLKQQQTPHLQTHC